MTSGSYIGLRTINTRARFDDVQANEVELSYLHGDHLGSNSLMTDASGAIVPNSQAAYLPFGDWRNEPSTSDLTDVGYTGHRHNNTNNNDVGLIYMNARYYVPSIGRFASADTIVPSLTNPQDFNRFSYVSNNPILFTDPTGHCAETGDTDCWEFLEKEFCMNGLLCENFWEWIIAGAYIDGRGETIVSQWTISELKDVRSAILAVRNALITIGFDDWRSIIGDTKIRRLRKWDREANADFVGGVITLFNGTFRKIEVRDLNGDVAATGPRGKINAMFTVVHEIGHAIDKNNGSKLRQKYFDLSNGYYFIDSMDNEYPLVGYGFYLRGANRQAGEAWADAFASWVIGLRFPYESRDQLQVAQNNYIDWTSIDTAVVTTLNEVIEP